MSLERDGVVVIDASELQPAQLGESLHSNRTAFVNMQSQMVAAEISIIVITYNRLEKIKRCIHSVLENSAGLDYQLILIDNGSTDGTLEYLKNIPYQNKIIYHLTKNLGLTISYSAIPLQNLGKYVVMLTDDLILTPYWLKNLLNCAKSDDRIGMVNPVSSNASNLQGIDLPYSSYNDMMRTAAKWNKSDARKWEQRQRLITLGTLYRKEALIAIGWPLADVGFYHDFVDDDISFRIRHAGYKIILAKDTWICHDHDVFHGEGKDPKIFEQSIAVGRNNFKEKHFGIDAWDDINNYYIPFMNYFPKPTIHYKATILGVDVKCGTPILDVKNWLRQFDVYETTLSAFTQDAKYWRDLKTICNGVVQCDREEFLIDSFPTESFDYIVIDCPINCYHEPQKIINDAFQLCKKHGFIIFKLLNTHSFQEFANILGQTDIYNPQIAYNIPVKVLQDVVERLGNICATIPVMYNLQKEQQDILKTLLPNNMEKQQCDDSLLRMQCKEYLFIVERV